MKKQYSSPYLRVVAIKNDIIATSTTAQVPVGGSGLHRVSERSAWGDYDDDYDY